MKPEPSTNETAATLPVGSGDWLAALGRLKEKRKEIDRQIAIVKREIAIVKREMDYLKRTETINRRFGPNSRGQKIAVMVLKNGATIKDAAKAEHTGQVNARRLLHEYCHKMNPSLYASGYHHNKYADGSENDCPPLLEWLREHAHDFCG